MSARRPEAELFKGLAEQVDELTNAAQRYDDGAPHAAGTMAVKIRVIAHDPPAGRGSPSRSLLGQLGIKDSLEYLDTAGPVNPRNLMTTWGLIGVQLEAGPGTSRVQYRVKLGDGYYQGPRLSFHGWWNDAVTKVVGADGFELSRQEYVRAVADKEGGAHLDPDFHRRYEQLSRQNAFGVMGVSDGAMTLPFGDPWFAAVRQVAYELGTTLIDQVPGLREAVARLHPG